MKSGRIHYYIPEEGDTEAQKWIASALTRSGYTQAELGHKLHLSRQAICAWVTGRAKPNFCEIVAVCHVCVLSDDPQIVWNKIYAKERTEAYDKLGSDEGCGTSAVSES